MLLLLPRTNCSKPPAPNTRTSLHPFDETQLPGALALLGRVRPRTTACRQWRTVALEGSFLRFTFLVRPAIHNSARLVAAAGWGPNSAAQAAGGSRLTELAAPYPSGLEGGYLAGQVNHKTGSL